MNSNYPSNITTRKSISTIVGTIFFLIILLGTMSAFVAAFNFTSELFQEQIEISDRELAKVQEQFTSLANIDFTDPLGLRLDVLIENKGSVPIEFTEIWIVDKIKKKSQLIDIKLADAHVPIATKKNLLENQLLYLELGGEYNIKAVTSRGNAPIMNLTISPKPPTPLVVTLTSIPSEIANNSNFTLVMTVFNNSTVPFFNVKAPGLPVVLPEDSVISVEQTSVSKYAQVNPGQSVQFTWDYYIQAAVGKKISFLLTRRH